MDSATSTPSSGRPSVPSGTDGLFASLYAELHRLARLELRRSGNASLSATTLLHEAFLSLRERDPVRFPDRAHFIAYAARAMRGVIVDYARNRRAQKRGGAFHLTTFDTDSFDASAGGDDDLPQIADALAALGQVEPSLAELVDLKFFCGLTIPEIAALRNVSERTIRRDWLKARVYLRRALADASV
jgi:RNA polymerase sigma factor (TIGR02999 family)